MQRVSICIFDKKRAFFTKTQCLYAFWAVCFPNCENCWGVIWGEELMHPLWASRVWPDRTCWCWQIPGRHQHGIRVRRRLSGFIEGMFSHIAWKLFNQEPLGFFRSSPSILEIFSYIFVCLCSSVFPFERGFGLMYSIAFQSMCLIQNNYLGKDIISTSGDLTKKRRFDIGKSFVECYWFIVPVLVCLSVVFGWFFLTLR